MRRPSIVVLSAAAFVLPLALAAASQSCSGGGAADAGGDGNPYGNPTGPCADGTIQMASCTATTDGGLQLESFSDEACVGLDTAESRSGGAARDDTQAPMVDQPTEAQVLPRATPFTFTWHPTGLSYHRAPVRLPSWRDELGRWGQLVPSAEAHCPSFGGIGYGVIFTADGQQILRANTAHTSYQPTADAWSHLVAARGTIALTLEVARFDDNAVPQGQGPYVSATPRHFTIAQ